MENTSFVRTAQLFDKIHRSLSLIIFFSSTVKEDGVGDKKGRGRAVRRKGKYFTFSQSQNL